VILSSPAGTEWYPASSPTVEVVLRYRSWKGIGIHPRRPHNLGCAPWRYLGVTVNSSLSFRKESIQRSSHASETMNQALEAQGPKAARDQQPFSFTTVLTMQ